MKIGISLIIALLCIPVISFAHGSHGSGFLAGFTHPIFGLDHNLAILGIGILGAFKDTKRWYLYPLAFWIPMVAGGIFGVDQQSTPLIEKIISLSVILVGLFISFDFTPKKYIIPGLLLIFGLFHGFAHGAEMPETTTVTKYVLGFSAGTILLSGIGILFYFKISTLKNSDTLMKIIGGFLIGAGTIFLVG